MGRGAAKLFSCLFLFFSFSDPKIRLKCSLGHPSRNSGASPLFIIVRSQQRITQQRIVFGPFCPDACKCIPLPTPGGASTLTSRSLISGLIQDLMSQMQIMARSEDGICKRKSHEHLQIGTPPRSSLASSIHRDQHNPLDHLAN